MSFNATIHHKGSVYIFEIRREAPGIYLAYWVYSEDENIHFPGKITLIRGVRNWKGSIEDETALSRLGSSIEDYYTEQKAYKALFKIRF